MAQRPDIQKSRRTNLNQILAEVDGPTVLAHRMGLKGPSFISQMGTGHRKITDNTARKIEEAASKPRYWLDEPHSAYSAPNGNGADAANVSAAVTAVVAVQQALKAEITPEKYAMIVELVYEQARTTGSIDEAFARKLVELTI